MADSNDAGFLRGERTLGKSGPLIVQGPSGGSLGSTNSTASTGGIYDPASGTTLTVKTAILNQAASGTAQTLVAAVTGKKIRVVAAVFVAGATATNLTFNSAAVAITPIFANGVNGGATLPFDEHGWFETVAGEALTVTTGAGSATGILVRYIEV